MRSEPVALVHGLGSSFEHGWRSTGWTDLLADSGRDVVAVDILGHGTAERPYDPTAYRHLETSVGAALPDGVVDAIGFSLGAQLLLRLAASDPDRGAVGAALGYPGGGALTVVPAAVTGSYRATGRDIYDAARVDRELALFAGVGWVHALGPASGLELRLSAEHRSTSAQARSATDAPSRLDLTRWITDGAPGPLGPELGASTADESRTRIRLSGTAHAGLGAQHLQAGRRIAGKAQRLGQTRSSGNRRRGDG